MTMHFATVWETIADAIPDEVALVHGDVRRTWREYDERAARLASAFTGAGLGPDSKIGIYLYNGNEYLETQYAGFKLRGVPVNVNYRYLDDELLVPARQRRRRGHRVPRQPGRPRGEGRPPGCRS